MECARKHTASSNEQIDVTQRSQNGKMNMLHRLLAVVRKHVNIDQNNVIKRDVTN